MVYYYYDILTTYLVYTTLGECIGDLLKSMLSVPLGLDHAAAHNNAVAAAVDSPSAKEALRKLSLHCM